MVFCMSKRRKRTITQVYRKTIKVPPALIYDCMVTEVLELRFVRTLEEQLKIIAARHHDPTAGHILLHATLK